MQLGKLSIQQMMKQVQEHSAQPEWGKKSNISNFIIIANIMYHALPTLKSMFSKERSSKQMIEHFHWLKEEAMCPKLKSMQKLSVMVV